MDTTAFAGRRLHFIAIGGAGMSALALVAHALGAEVTGSDRAESSYLPKPKNSPVAIQSMAMPSDPAAATTSPMMSARGLG